MFVPGCMWQTMHWLVGIAVVNDVLDRMARLVLRDHRDRSSGSSRDCPPSRTARSAPASDRWRRPRGRRCSRSSGSRPDESLVPRKLSVGSSRRVFCRPMNTGSVRFSVPRPRLLKRFPAGPVLRPAPGCRLRAARVPPRSKMRSTLPGCVTSHAAADRERAGCPWRLVSSRRRRRHGVDRRRACRRRV